MTVGAGAAASGLGLSGYLSWLSYKKLSGLFHGREGVTAGEARAAMPPEITPSTLGARLGGASESLGILGMLAAWASQGDKIDPSTLKLAPSPETESSRDVRRRLGIAGARAAGGPVLSGKTYLVGERGPELFAPGASGSIVNNSVTKAMLAKSDEQDSKTADEIRAMSFRLATAVESISRAIDRQDRATINGASFGTDGGSGGGGGVSSGRRGFMARGGHFGGRRGFMARGQADASDLGPHVRLGHMGSGGRRGFEKFDAKAPAIVGGLMTKYGLTREQAAGIVGNLGHESARFTAYHEGGQAPGKGGVGWAQWTGSRRRAFEAWTRARGLNPTSDEASWRYFTEGDPETNRAIAAVKRQASTVGAMTAFEHAFERSADYNQRTGAILKPGSVQDRINLANRALRLSGAADTSVASLRRKKDGAAGDVHSGLHSLRGVDFAPAVDNAHLRETAALLDHIHHRITKIGSLSKRHTQAGTQVAGLGARLRGGFSHAGSGFG